MFGRFTKKRQSKPRLGAAPTYAYYRSPVNAAKPALKPAKSLNKSKSVWHYAPSLIALVAVLSTLAYSLYISSSVVLKTEGAMLYRDKQEYVSGINKLINSSVLNRSKLTINSTKLEQQIQASYPEVASVTVALPLVGHAPVVGIRFADPALKFVSAGQQLILDTAGKVLPLSVVNAALPIVTDESGISYKVGDRALSLEEVGAINAVYNEVLAHDKKVASLKIGTAPKELQLQIEGANYFVKFKLDKTAREQAGALWATLDKLANENKKPTSYIDVRLAERVFVL